eukprot:scaffold731_cov261-Pinguiococcus_pyrenoidosus.AAC.99
MRMSIKRRRNVQLRHRLPNLSLSQYEISPALQRIVGAEELPRTEVTKKIWVYIREHSLQDENDRRTILWDEVGEEVFGLPSCSMFKIAKLVNVHLRDVGSDTPFGDPQVAAEAVLNESADSKPKKRRKTDKNTRAQGEGRGPTYDLSDALADVVGSTQMKRTEVTKQLWVYIREHSLQNPEDRREILCDDALQSIFGKASVSMFEMAKLIGAHLTKI